VNANQRKAFKKLSQARKLLEEATELFGDLRQAEDGSGDTLGDQLFSLAENLQNAVDFANEAAEEQDDDE
jgi:hypothetical protein